MVDSIKQYNVGGVASTVELGKKGSKIVGSADQVALKNNAETSLINAEVADGVNAQDAITLRQLNASTDQVYSKISQSVSYNSGNVTLGTASANTYVLAVAVEKGPGNWTDADSSTEITVGDSANNARLYSGFDLTTQTIDETDYKYTADTDVVVYVTQGSASAGTAVVTVWYSGTIS